MFLNFRNILFNLILVLLLGQCNYSGSFQRETEIFDKFLETNFNRRLDGGIECFLIVPDNSCLGCIKLSVTIVEECKNLVVIATPNVIQDNIDFININNLLEDNSYMINRLDLGQRNTYIVISKGGKIQSIIPITPSSEKVIWQRLRDCECH